MVTCAVVRESDNVVLNTIVANTLEDPVPEGCFLIPLYSASPGAVWLGPDDGFAPVATPAE
jgi:hypothetical protein